MASKQAIINSVTEIEQRIFVKFGILLGWSGGVIEKNLKKAIGRKAFSERTIYNWMKKINDGRFDMNEQRGGDTSDYALRIERVDQVRDAMEESRHWSVRSLSLHLNIPIATVHSILTTELKMTKKLGKWVPHDLTEDQKMARVLACKTNLQEYSKHPKRLKKTFSVDETWVSLYMEPDRNQARVYLYPGEEPPNIPRANIHATKRMLIMAVDFNGIAFWKLQPEKSSVTGEAYVSFLKENLPGWLSGKRFRSPVLLHDNAKPHVAKIVKDFLKEEKIDTWFQPAYSPDISPLDFDCFGKLKTRLRLVNHRNWAEFEDNVAMIVESLNQEQQILGIQRLPDRWQRVIDCEGCYL